jgi:hypothetical protein
LAAIEIISPEPRWAEAGCGVQKAMVAVASGDNCCGFGLAWARGGYSYCLLLVALCLVKLALISILKYKNTY